MISTAASAVELMCFLGRGSRFCIRPRGFHGTLRPLSTSPEVRRAYGRIKPQRTNFDGVFDLCRHHAPLDLMFCLLLFGRATRVARGSMARPPGSDGPTTSGPRTVRLGDWLQTRICSMLGEITCTSIVKASPHRGSIIEVARPSPCEYHALIVDVFYVLTKCFP